MSPSSGLLKTMVEFVFEGNLAKDTVMTQFSTVVKLEVYVWGAIRFDSRSSLQVLQQNVNGEMYCRILNFLGGSRFPDGQRVLHQDNAPAQRCQQVVTQFLRDSQISTLKWSLKPPDLNPIEHVWDNIGRRVQFENPKTLPQLERLLLDQFLKTSSATQ